MAATLSVQIDWLNTGNFAGPNDDVTADVNGDPGETLVRIQRGSSLRGEAGGPGQLQLVLDNQSNKYTPGNTSSPLNGNILPSRRIRVRAVESGTTYYLFYGWIRRFVPRGEFGHKKVEVFAEDALWRFSRLEAAIPLSDTLSINGFRAALLDNIGENSSYRSLSTASVESSIPVTGADQEDALSILGSLNAATATIHFIRYGNSPPYQYVTLDRTALQTASSVATYLDADTASWGDYDMTDERLINTQNVIAQPFQPGESEQLLWERKKRYSVGAGQTRILWARWDEPLIIGGRNPVLRNRRKKPATGVRISYDSSGTPTVTTTFYSTMAKIQVAGGASGATLSHMQLYGYPAETTALEAVRSQNATSVTNYGVWLGNEVASEFLNSESEAQGLADYIVYRYRDPRSRPVITLQRNEFPDVFQREPGQRITATNSLLGVSAMQFIVESTTLTMVAGGSWWLNMGCQEVEAGLNIFTVGGTSGQGVGGSAVLGY